MYDAYSTDLGDTDLSQEVKEKHDEVNGMQTDLFFLHLTMLNYALERGFSYQRWQTIANTILLFLKDEENVRLHRRTWVIHIYEADFNLALGIQWLSHSDVSSRGIGRFERWTVWV